MRSFARGASALTRLLRIRSLLIVRERLRSQILRNTSWLLEGQILQLAGRFGYFIIVAHALGPRDYGSFIACTALVSIVSPFASFGTGHVMIKYVARNRHSLPSYFGNALFITASSGSILMLLLVQLKSILLPPSVTTSMLVTIAMADLIATEMTGICLQVFLVLERGRTYSHLLACSTACRVVAAVCLVFSAHTAARWASLYCTSAFIGLGIAVYTAIRSSAQPRLNVSSVPDSMREGFHFATSLASQSIYNDIDKTMLARLSTVEATAIYAVAYRFIEPSLLPIRAAASASYPEFFRHGENGVRSGFTFARSILPYSMLYGAVAALLVYWGAGFIPFVLGAAYSESTVALRWLCILPFLKSIHVFLSDTLTGCNYQWQTSSAQICVAALNTIANLWLIRVFAWRGAAWSSLATDALLMVILLVIIRFHIRQENRTFALQHSGVEPAIEG
jgi:O-antigen/teichoic acid export membrane protein